MSWLPRPLLCLHPHLQDSQSTHFGSADAKNRVAVLAASGVLSGDCLLLSTVTLCLSAVPAGLLETRQVAFAVTVLPLLQSNKRHA